jgi:hypothetical protein
MQKLLGHQPLTPVQWVPVLAALLLLLVAEDPRGGRPPRQWTVAGPIGPEPPGHQTLRRRAAAG